MVSEKYYFDIVLEGAAPEKVPESELVVRRRIEECLLALWGSVGAAATTAQLAVLRWCPKSKRALLRVSRAHATRVAAALAIDKWQLGPGGKDIVLWATRADHATPSTISLPEPEPAPGLILPSGDINWSCPCLGGMATGPCGMQFREAFSCFHYSEAEPKGSDCYEKFSEMQACMAQYPELYARDDDDADEDAPAVPAAVAGAPPDRSDAPKEPPADPARRP
ncbi:Mitochondrial intermembrane space import and assembly protein 40 [Eumeta japonica]|uniref:Mitochondrial intermembrane space import and assembly protein 40 n=1 Tax=Eumeta variegata TaxID=151549 RepID=A0A4C1TH00_EUMVA|nr:Mitochondrial intermembrane space import and assembly protein 40 [Eumeta japonica]